ncbi:hypothetical protein SEA_DAUBENSKI_232 [Streptomyces phage Daubenski]|uniref:KTSC domain-containing protein n=1 Tax=Streptomyces phage Daubenski TaxID=2653725 RepID=A0A5Q2WIJ2_9CAUD|nr:hypothetical protein KNU80_gp073 [Streptomyces phage Daubenski]QGH76499.1 hypothetical protein SEA_DAUBENSKI_232 [Streptomyces phage Daubenski]
MEFVYTNSLGTNSSTMQAIYWNEGTQELVIHFWAGSVIKYTGFTADDYRAFTSALSKGRFYNQYVKGSFRGEKLADDTRFVHELDVPKPAVAESTELEAVLTPPVQITVNIYVSGDPDKIADAVERLAPSLKAVQNWRR